jgi:hypothetical protein
MLPRFVSSALVGGVSASRPDRLTSRDPMDGRLGEPRTCLDRVEMRKFLALLGLDVRLFGRPARSQLLYRLSHPYFKEYGRACKIMKTRQVERV